MPKKVAVGGNGKKRKKPGKKVYIAKNDKKKKYAKT